MGLRRLVLLGVCAIAAPHRLAAQSLGGVPPPPQGSPLPGIERRQQPQLAPPTVAPPVAPGVASPSAVLAITAVAPVQGVLAYPPGQFDVATAGLVGPAVKLSRIEAARTAILNRYRADGYLLIDVQAHISRAGLLTFRVTEGHIVDVKLEGDQRDLATVGPAGNLVLKFLRNLVADRAVNSADLERYILLAGDIPGMTVSTRLDPAHDEGAFVLVAQVRRQAVQVQLTADNRAFRKTGPEELLATFNLNSFTSLGERTQVSLYHTFNNTDTFGQASEQFFVGSDGAQVRVYGGAGESVPSGQLRAIGYDGVTRVFGGAFIFPWLRSRDSNLTVSALFDGVESDIATNATGRSARASFDSLRVLRGSADYSFNDLLVPGQLASNFIEAVVSQGLPAFGASPNGARDAPRLHERIDFTKGFLEVDRTQPLFVPFRNAYVALKLAAEGQYSENILPPEEQLYLGGPHFNRGFYYGQVTGDSGLAVTIEPQLDVPLFQPGQVFGPAQNGSPLLARYVGKPVRAQFYGFYDWGEVWQNQKLDLDHTLRSLGAGVRFYSGERYGNQNLELDLEGVYRLTTTPDGTPPEVSELKSWAFYWQVLVSY